MEPSQSAAEELTFRIRNDLAFFHGDMPESFAIAWRAYLAAIMEWNILGFADYERLLQMLPEVPEDPAVAILRGRE